MDEVRQVRRDVLAGDVPSEDSEPEPRSRSCRAAARRTGSLRQGAEVGCAESRPALTCPAAACSLHKVQTDYDQEDVMSRTRNARRPTARALEWLVTRRRAVRTQQELRAALAGLHGEGVRADVLAAMER